VETWLDDDFYGVRYGNSSAVVLAEARLRAHALLALPQCAQSMETETVFKFSHVFTE
jgi:hypothetical protein